MFVGVVSSSVVVSVTFSFLSVILQGRIECFDPRVRRRVGLLDVAASLGTDASFVAVFS